MSNSDLLEAVDRCTSFMDSCTREWEGRVQFGLHEQKESGFVRLTFLQAAKPNQGDGQRFMDFLKRMADDQDVTLDLIAMADEPQFQQSLIGFYERNGFSRKGNQLVMTRAPHLPYE